MSRDLVTALQGLPHELRSFDAGATLFCEGDEVQRLYLIESGEVHLQRHQAGGYALTLQRAGPGVVLAEASFFSDRYHCDATAVSPVRSLSFDRRVVHAGMSREPALALVLAEHLAREVQKARQRAEILALRTVSERLDAWTASSAGRLPERGEWKTVATEIGVSAEALYRELARRRSSGGG